MQFTEHELTLAVTGAAKAMAGARRRRANPDEVWETLSKLDRYHHLEAARGQVVPVLLALPDVTVHDGSRATFSDAEVVAAVEEALGDTGRGWRRKATILTRAALVKAALTELPLRQDPHRMIVPDSL
ncbi:hypothetical protein [Nostocoides sp.]|jgi:hypothetical protein|uniref:hypothetical protein n=1 Tax=Nostocoides sp. TaxID=1917966 RepID=UPI002BBB5D3F|nr:hypothetical protein [Tetrasphaera sp.]